MTALGNQPCRSKAEHRWTVRHDAHQPACVSPSFLTSLHSFITFINTSDKGDKKGKRPPPPLISIYRHTILHSHMQSDHAPCSVSKVNLVTLSLEPLFIFKAVESILSVHQGAFFFFCKLQSSISRAKAVPQHILVTVKML